MGKSASRKDRFASLREEEIENFNTLFGYYIYISLGDVGMAQLVKRMDAYLSKFTADHPDMAAKLGDFYVAKTTLDKWDSEDTGKPSRWQPLILIGIICDLTYARMDRLLSYSGHPSLEVLLDKEAKPEERIFLRKWFQETPLQKFEVTLNQIKIHSEKTFTTVEGIAEQLSFLATTTQERVSVLGMVEESKPRLFYVPSDISYFTGRESQLKQLKQHLIETNGSRIATIAGITGMAGIGKSLLAIHFAHKYEKYFPDGVFFLSADSDPVDVLAKKFAFYARHPIDPQLQLSATEIMQSVFRDRQALLIFDNVKDATILSLLPGGEKCAVIITTRHRGQLADLDAYGAATVDLPGFTLDEMMVLLTHQIGQEQLSGHQQAAETIHKLVGGLPLAIQIIGSTLKRRKYMTLTTYLELLQQETDMLSRLKVQGNNNLNVEASFTLSVKLLEKEERELFARLGACVAEDFSFSAALAVSGQSVTLVNDTIGRLIELSFINQGRDTDRFVLHPLLFVFARNLARTEGLLEDAEQRHTEYFFQYLQKRQGSSALDVKGLLSEIDALLLTAQRLKGDLDKSIDFYIRLEPLLQSIGYCSQALAILDTLLEEGRKQQRPYEIAYCLLQR
jgi:hypothetical protein